MAKSGYDVYVGKCLLPVTPDKIEIKINNNNKTIILMNDGEINILKTAKLSDIEFECVLPQVKYPYATYKSGFKKAEYFLNYFETQKTRKRPFQFIVSRHLPNGKSLFNTNFKVSMEDYKITEDAKEGFDVKVKIKLKQYRNYGTKTVTIAVQDEKPAATMVQLRETENAPTPETSSETYTVRQGDCLCTIAKRFYGDSSKYTVIYDANKDVVGANPNKIYAGQTLTIPPI